MKAKYFLFFIGYVLISACNSSDKNTAISTIVETNLRYNDQLIEKYSSFLMELDTATMENSVVAAKEYAKLFERQDKNTCDSAFFTFKKYYNKLNNTINDLHYNDTTLNYDSLLIDLNTISKTQLSKNLKAYGKRLNTNGFKVDMTEGETYISQDPDFIEKWFYKYVSPQLKECLIQLSKEDKEAFAEDASLMITPTQFVDRIVWWEKFIAKYPNATTTKESKQIWNDYLSILLRGMDNTPVIDFDKPTISEYYNNAYSYLQKSFPETQTNRIVNPYFKLLTQNKNREAEQLLEEYKTEKVINY